MRNPQSALRAGADEEALRQAEANVHQNQENQEESKSFDSSELGLGDPIGDLIGGMQEAEGYNTEEHGMRKHMESDDSFDFQD